MKVPVFLASLVLLFCIGFMFFLSSGFVKQREAKYMGHSEICVDGIEYIQFISGASVKYNSDGTISKCR